MWTAHHWQHWLDHGTFPDHPWRTYLQRSALTLKGLTYAPTGAMVAAATTSLPETPGGERNWDYRYTWIRDSTFMLWGLYTLGFDWEANDFFYFIADVAEGEEDLQIMYGIGGERELTESTLDHLSGYEGARPVRIGNGAYNQRQHDVWGAVLDSVYLHTKSRDHLDERVWPILKRQVEAAIDNWREPDRGIWEVRGEPKHFTSSKLMCWVALDRGARLARLREDGDCADPLAGDRRRDPRRRLRARRRRARRLHAALRHRRARRVGPAHPARPLPAAPTTSACGPRCWPSTTSSRWTGSILRYRVEETDDGLSGEEGTFAICSFWMVSALCGDRRGADGARPVREAPRVRLAARPLRRGDRPAVRAGTWATSRRRSPTWP